MQQIQKKWEPPTAYSEPVPTVVAGLATDVLTGLSKEIAKQRLESQGANAVGRQTGVNPLGILIEQFRGSVVILLLVAAGISAVLHEYLQTAGIIVAVIINAVVGFITEYQAKLSLEKLAKLAGAMARVKRDGTEQFIAVADLVPGDIVLLLSGDRVPADARLLEGASLSVDESILTGESVPAWKDASAKENFESAVLFQGTMVCSGRAKAVVITTGAQTRLGALACAIDAIDSNATPLEKDLDALGHVLTWLTLAICAIVGITGLITHALSPLHLLQTATALAVAAIPEGLPVVATLAMAIGIGRMVRKRALVRRLTAVETLGCTTVICTDKTGTLTENRMTVKEIVIDSADDRNQKAQALVAAALCNDATIQIDPSNPKNYKIVGDPTEGALLVAAQEAGLSPEELLVENPRIAEFPFDLNRKRMSTLHATTGGTTMLLACKGSPETVIPLCTSMSAVKRAWLEAKNAELADMGLRVLAVAKREFNGYTICIDQQTLESDLTFLGLIGMSDTLRPEAKDAIEACRRAGIRIMMLTGDQPRTAEAIGHELSIDSADVLARVTPEMKLATVQQLQSQRQIVAMTGDGVNDAPALKQADIGIAMGLNGSDLARDASSLVITDDNFATIVSAIEEGRAIYRNIKRAVAYLLTASLSSLVVVALGVFFSKELLLTPLQLLWLNLIMHIFPGLGLVLQRDTKDSMLMPPRRPGEHILTREMIVHIVARALFVAAIAITTPLIAHRVGTGESHASIVLAVISIALILQSWSWLSDRSIDKQGKILASINPLNIPMMVNTAVGVTLLLAALYLPALQPVLQTKPLSGQEMLVALATAFASFIVSFLFNVRLPRAASSPASLVPAKTAHEDLSCKSSRCPSSAERP